MWKLVGRTDVEYSLLSVGPRRAFEQPQELPVTRCREQAMVAAECASDQVSLHSFFHSRRSSIHVVHVMSTSTAGIDVL